MSWPDRMWGHSALDGLLHLHDHFGPAPHLGRRPHQLHPGGFVEVVGENRWPPPAPASMITGVTRRRKCFRPAGGQCHAVLVRLDFPGNPIIITPTCACIVSPGARAARPGPSGGQSRILRVHPRSQLQYELPLRVEGGLRRSQDLILRHGVHPGQEFVQREELLVRAGRIRPPCRGGHRYSPATA